MKKKDYSDKDFEDYMDIDFRDRNPGLPLSRRQFLKLMGAASSSFSLSANPLA
jgi:hypothetical protein